MCLNDSALKVVIGQLSCFSLHINNRQLRVANLLMYRVAQKTGPPYLIANILEISRPSCVEIGELLQYYMLNTVINFLFKNFIPLWRHLAKTQLLCDAQIYLYNVNKRQ